MGSYIYRIASRRDLYSLKMNGIKHIESSDQCNGNNWCNQFRQLWARSDYLFGLLRSEEDFYRQPIKLRLPLLFYLGHLPCFAWLQFRHFEGVNKVIDKLYDQLFERGVDPDVQTGIVNHEHSSQFSVDDDTENEYWRSFSVQSITEYKNKVRAEIIQVLINGNLHYHDIQTLNILNVALEHEMMHQETLMYLYLHVPIEGLRLPSTKKMDLTLRQVNVPLSENRWVTVPGGRTSLGKPYNEDVKAYSYGWDNEFPSEPTYVTSFELQTHPVRIGDYLDFVLDHGYTTEQWWDKDTFQWLIQSKITHPASWTYEKSYRVNFILQRNLPIESVLDHPVLVSQSEAKAYCRWLSHKTGSTIDLPTEAEWIYAMWNWSQCLPTALIDNQCNINFRHLHTMPIDSCENDRLQWHGSAFEWTSSLFRPLNGYRGSLPSYPGYSSDFFDDQHFVLLGGSFATDRRLIRRSFRNWYQAIYRYVFATFRCVKRNGHTDHPLTSTDRDIIIKTLSNTKHRSIQSHYFYDAHGSAIYEQITQLDEYYLFNQELQLLRKHAKDIRTTILQSCSAVPSDVHFIELGCGDGSKVETWLSPWVNLRENIFVVYHPVDISQHAIDALIGRLQQTMGSILVEQHVKPICSTFERMYAQLDENVPGLRVLMLLGSTIGNFSSFDSNNVKYGDEAPVMKFFRSARSHLKVSDWFLCGFDLCKDPKTMITAYNDNKGITAAFNYNLLQRLNRELNFNFTITNYQHYATFNPLFRRMESWLISTKQQTVTDQHGFTLQLEPFEAIQTELSTKYTEEDIQILMKKNSFRIIQCYRTEEHHLPYVLCMAQAI